MNINTNFLSIEQMTEVLNNNDKTKKIDSTKNNNEVSFEDILKSKSTSVMGDGVVFSKHANERLESRNIELSQEQMDRLNDGTKLAKQKGINDSLVLVDEYAFIVNIKNNTVVTAVNDGEKNVFTNIDGAVIA